MHDGEINDLTRDITLTLCAPQQDCSQVLEQLGCKTEDVRCIVFKPTHCPCSKTQSPEVLTRDVTESSKALSIEELVCLSSILQRRVAHATRHNQPIGFFPDAYRSL
jgi:hypothetical protein